MLALIYSEILKMLRLWGLVNFDAEIFFPHDDHTLPRGYHKQKSKESDQEHIMTSENLLYQVISDCCCSSKLLFSAYPMQCHVVFYYFVAIAFPFANFFNR